MWGLKLERGTLTYAQPQTELHSSGQERSISSVGKTWGGSGSSAAPVLGTAWVRFSKLFSARFVTCEA